MRNSTTLNLYDATPTGWIVSSLPMEKSEAYEMFREGHYPTDIYRVEHFDGQWYITSKPVK